MYTIVSYTIHYFGGQPLNGPVMEWRSTPISNPIITGLVAFIACSRFMWMQKLSMLSFWHIFDNSQNYRYTEQRRTDNRTINVIQLNNLLKLLWLWRSNMRINKITNCFYRSKWHRFKLFYSRPAKHESGYSAASTSNSYNFDYSPPNIDH